MHLFTNVIVIKNCDFTGLLEQALLIIKNFELRKDPHIKRNLNLATKKTTNKLSLTSVEKKMTITRFLSIFDLQTYHEYCIKRICEFKVCRDSNVER